MMNIAWHMPTLHESICGLSLRALEMAARLCRGGAAVTFFVEQSKTDVTGDAVRGMALRRLEVLHDRPAHWCLQALARSSAARRIARRIGRRWDLVISCQPEVVSEYAALADRPPVLFVCGSTTLHHDGADRLRQAALSVVRRGPFWIDRRLKRRNERRAFRRADAVVFDSEQTRELAIAAYGLESERCQTIHGGVDATVFSPPSVEQRRAARGALGIGDNEAVVVWTGRMSPEKNLELLIDAAARCRRRPDLLLVGDGPSRAGLERRVVGRGLDSTVRFVGRQADVRPFLHACDVFAFPSRGESFGGSLVEALACGLPAVVLRPDGDAVVNASIEIVADGGCGLLVDSSEPGAFAEAMDSLLTDDGLRRRLGQAGRDWVKRRFTWEQAAGRLHELLCGLVEPTAAGQRCRRAATAEGALVATGS